MQRVIKRHKKYILFIVFILIISILCGYFYYSFLDNSLKLNIINSVNNIKINNILKDLIIMSTILISSIFLLGTILGIIYIFYEGFTIGFVSHIFFTIYKLKGIIYILKYIILGRLLVLLLIIIFVYKIINISRYIIGYIIYKDSNIKNRILINFKNNICIIVFVLIINIIIFFVI